MPLHFFAKWRGFRDQEQVETATICFDKNMFDARQPMLKDLCKARFLSFFTIFQLF